jgi:arylsulfatase A-like enzyme
VKHLILLSALLTASVVPAARSSAADKPARPNILIIVADDLGNADLGIQGGKDIPTPAIDGLAKSGVRLTSGYVSGPYCSPTRAGLLTGRYQNRFGHEFNPGPPAAANVTAGLPLSETTLADRLKAGGYRTGMVGKWHLGHDEDFHPLSRGFEEYFGFLGGAHAYLPNGANKGPNAIQRGRTPVDEKEYLTDAFAREAVAYVDRHKSEPFFLYLTFNAVHGPLEATEEYAKPFDGIANPKRRTYAGMLTALDKAVGQVLKKLQDEKIDENTLIFFISDNGGPPVNASSNGELRGYKAQTWEGGVRVPFFVTWAKHLPQGTTYNQPAIQLDIAPTVLAAAGIETPGDAKFDGVNLLPYLKGENTAVPHDKLYWRFGQQRAIRAGDWKLVKAIGVEDWQLINLAKDIGETTDLSAQEPGKRKELEAAWNAWHKTLEEPRWKANRAKAGGGGGKKKRKAAAES